VLLMFRISIDLKISTEVSHEKRGVTSYFSDITSRATAECRSICWFLFASEEGRARERGGS